MMPRDTAARTVEARAENRPTALVLLPVAAAVALAGAVARFPILTPDVWWHLATGREIARSGIPHTDPFSYTLGGRAWLAHEWLADLVMHGADAAAGLGGVVLLRTLLLVAAAVFGYRQARIHAGLLVALAVMLPAVAATQRNWLDRPQLWSFVLAPLVVGLLERHRLQGSRAVWVLPCVFALWVNLHGGFMLGLGVVVLWAVAERLGPRRSAGRKRLPIGVVVACALATLANPYGLRGALYPLHYVGSGLAATIQEEQPGSLDSPYAWVHFGVALALVLALVVPWVRRRSVPLPHVVVGLALVWLSMPRLHGVSLPLAAERHAPLFLFAGSPILAWQIEALWGGAPERWAVRHRAVLRAAPAWIAAGALAGLIFWQAVRGLPHDASPQALVVPGRFPEAGARWLAGHDLPPHLINPYRWGGFLAYRLAPRYRVWIDSRGDLYGPERLREDELLYRMPPGSGRAVEALLDRYDADVIVWYFLTLDFGRLEVHPFTRWLLARPDWRLVFYDRADPTHPQAPWATTAVFVRDNERNAALLQSLPRQDPPPGLPR
jgi:hypothetical protein